MELRKRSREEKRSRERKRLREERRSRVEARCKWRAINQVLISDSMPPGRQLDMATLKWAGLDAFLGQCSIPTLDRAQVAAFLSTYSSSSNSALVDGKRVHLSVADLCAVTQLPSVDAGSFPIDRAQRPATALVEAAIQAFLERLECGPFEPSKMADIFQVLDSTDFLRCSWGYYAIADLRRSIEKVQDGSLRTFRWGRWLTAVIRRALATDLELHPFPPVSSTLSLAALAPAAVSSSSFAVTSLVPAVVPSVVPGESAASLKQNATEEMQDGMAILPISCSLSCALEPVASGDSGEPEFPMKSPSSSPVHPKMRLESVEGASEANSARPLVREGIGEETVPASANGAECTLSHLAEAQKSLPAEELESKTKALAAALEQMILVNGATFSKWREEVDVLNSGCYQSDREAQAMQLKLNALKEQLKSAEAEGEEHEEELSCESVSEEFQDVQLEGENVKLALDRLQALLLTSSRLLATAEDTALNLRIKEEETLRSVTEARDTYDHEFEKRQMWEQEVKANLDACEKGYIFEFCNQSVKRVMTARQVYTEQIVKKQEKEKEVASLKEEEMSVKSMLLDMITDFFDASDYVEQRDWILSNAASIGAVPADGKWAPSEFCKLMDAYEDSKQVQSLLVEMFVRGDVKFTDAVNPRWIFGDVQALNSQITQGVAESEEDAVVVGESDSNFWTQRKFKLEGRLLKNKQT